MTMQEFMIECGQVLIDPALALENDRIRAALVANNTDEVKQALREEF